MDEDWLLRWSWCSYSLFYCNFLFWRYRFLGIAQLLQSLLMSYKRLLFFFARCIAILFIVWLYFSFDAAKYSFFPACLFHAYTHLYCPGCGSQRSLSALLHGDVKRALSYNVLLVASLPLVMYSAAVYTVNVFRRNAVQQMFVYSPFFIKACLWTVVTFFILRNLPFHLFSVLRPQ